MVITINKRMVEKEREREKETWPEIISVFCDFEEDMNLSEGLPLL